MKQRSERYEHQVGARRLDGHVQITGDLRTAEDKVRQFNQKAKAIGAPEAARVVTRRVHVVTITDAEPWQVTK